MGKKSFEGRKKGLLIKFYMHTHDVSTCTFYSVYIVDLVATSRYTLCLLTHCLPGTGLSEINILMFVNMKFHFDSHSQTST